jgi:hypothetical protein
MAANPPFPKPDKSVIAWLLDSDPSIRYMMSDGNAPRDGACGRAVAAYGKLPESKPVWLVRLIRSSGRSCIS